MARSSANPPDVRLTLMVVAIVAAAIGLAFVTVGAVGTTVHKDRTPLDAKVTGTAHITAYGDVAILQSGRMAVLRMSRSALADLRDGPFGSPVGPVGLKLTPDRELSVVPVGTPGATETDMVVELHDETLYGVIYPHKGALQPTFSTVVSGNGKLRMRIVKDFRDEVLTGDPGTTKDYIVVPVTGGNDGNPYEASSTYDAAKVLSKKELRYSFFAAGGVLLVAALVACIVRRRLAGQTVSATFTAY